MNLKPFSHTAILGWLVCATIVLILACDQQPTQPAPPGNPAFVALWDHFNHAMNEKGELLCSFLDETINFRANHTVSDSLFSIVPDDPHIPDSLAMCEHVLWASFERSWQLTSNGHIIVTPGLLRPPPDLPMPCDTLMYVMHDDSLTIELPFSGTQTFVRRK